MQILPQVQSVESQQNIVSRASQMANLALNTFQASKTRDSGNGAAAQVNVVSSAQK